MARRVPRVGFVRLVGVVAVLVGLVLAAAAAPVAAAEPVPLEDRGWWSRLNQEPTIGAVVSATPDVAPGQLLVEGSPEGATAIAAVRATLPEGTTSPVLRLTVASDTGGEGAVLLACQAGSGWTGVHAGAWSAKPSPDCSQSVQGLRSEDGSEWTFAIAGLQFGDQVNVVLTPGQVAEDGPSSAFRLVFDVPEDALVVSKSSVSSPPTFPTISTLPPSSFGTGSSSTPAVASAASASSFSPPRPPTSSELASQPVQAALPAAEQGQTATSPVLAAASPVPPALPAPDSDEGRLLGALVVLAGLGTLYWSTTLAVPGRRVLSRFAAAGTARTTTTTATTDVGPAEPEQARIGGLGRFRRVRDTPARRLGT